MASSCPQSPYQVVRNDVPFTNSLSEFDHLVFVKESPGKGLGVFARQNIARGSRIFSEEQLVGPVPRVMSKDGINCDIDQLVKSHQSLFNGLSDRAKQSFLSLAGPLDTLAMRQMEEDVGRRLSAKQKTISAIFMANSFPSGTFHLVSRINHSCLPNTFATWHPSSKRLTVRAVRNIRMGQEITISYVPNSRVRRLRQDGLQGTYGFECTCPVCRDTVEGRRREETLAKIYLLQAEINQEMVGWQPSKDPEGYLLDSVRRLANMQRAAHTDKEFMET